MQITREVAEKVLATVDAGLSSGVGKPVPGEMCVEAAVCYALGLPHGDDPKCVAPALRALKIALNDKTWSSNQARAKGLRRLALAQLGSLGILDERAFIERVAKYAIGHCVPVALRAAARLHTDAFHRDALLDAARRCEVERTKAAAHAATYAADAATYAHAAHAATYAYAAAYAAHAATYAYAYAAAYADAAAHAAHAAADADHAAADADAYAAARDGELAEFAEGVVQILIDMGAPGCQWLDMTEAA